MYINNNQFKDMCFNSNQQQLLFIKNMKCSFKVKINAVLATSYLNKNVTSCVFLRAREKRYVPKVRKLAYRCKKRKRKKKRSQETQPLK